MELVAKSRTDGLFVVEVEFPDGSKQKLSVVDASVTVLVPYTYLSMDKITLIAPPGCMLSLRSQEVASLYVPLLPQGNR